jgi:hypothetical protein
MTKTRKRRNLSKPLSPSEFDYSLSQRQFDKKQKKKYGNLKKGIKERKTTEEKIDKFNKGMIKTNAAIIAGGLTYALKKRIGQ